MMPSLRFVRRPAVAALAATFALLLAGSGSLDGGPEDTAVGTAPTAAGTAVGVVAASGPAKADARQAARRSSAAGWLHTDGSKIVDAHGKPYRIQGISWFGLEIDTCTPHGLWQISMDTALNTIKREGFNTIRLPYANDCLRERRPNSIDYNKNRALRGKSPLQVMDAVVRGAKQRGLNVILDRHRPTSDKQSEFWYTSKVSERRWIADWKMLARRYKGNSTVIGFDLHNEPNGRSCWGCGDHKRDWASAAAYAGNQILRVNPKLLIVVQGTQILSDGGYTFWGGALDRVKTHPVRLNVPNRVVYSPHEYPASISWMPWFGAVEYPRNLPAKWDEHWGYIAKDDIAPVLLGEFGSKLQTRTDRQWMATMVNYLDKNNLSFSFWSYNPNSGDTGGIVKDDWRTPERDKLRAMRPLLR